MQGCAISFQPRLGGICFGTNLFENSPEAMGVVEFAQMGDFVRGEVVEHEVGGQDQTPREIQRATA